MPLLQLIAKIIKILRSEGTPGQIAMGFALGMLAGLIPMNTLHGILLWGIVILCNVSFGAFLFAFILFSGIAYLLDPFFHSLGYLLLVRIEFLHGFWTALYTAPLIPFTRFYNTVVMGSTVFGVVSFYPVYGGVKFFVIQYREKLDARIQQWKIVKMIKASHIYRLYTKM